MIKISEISNDNLNNQLQQIKEAFEIMAEKIKEIFSRIAKVLSEIGESLEKLKFNTDIDVEFKIESKLKQYLKLKYLKIKALAYKMWRKFRSGRKKE